MTLFGISIAMTMLVLGCDMRCAIAQTASIEQARKTITVKQDGKPAYRSTEQPPLSATKEIDVSVRARIVGADAAPEHEGQLLLEVFSKLKGEEVHDAFPVQQPRLIIQLPLSSAGDAYGESRSCSVSKEGGLTFVFTAGLDEKNFVPFTASDSDRDFRFSLNKYLCRALAAPFRCKSPSGSEIERKLPADMSLWEVGAHSSVALDSKTPSKAEVSEITLTSSGKLFDYATCAKIAPSNGLCCVAHKTTEWHCGVKPEGNGWHQVSGDCYHRETGGTCSDNSPL